jgi:hypothetical protein
MTTGFWLRYQTKKRPERRQMYPSRTELFVKPAASMKLGMIEMVILHIRQNAREEAVFVIDTSRKES